jgi:short-subunit dehydrogenase
MRKERVSPTHTSPSRQRALARGLLSFYKPEAQARASCEGSMGQRRNLQGMRVLVTGASQGIGRSLAVLAAKRGAKVLAAARSPQLLADLKTEIQKTGGVLETVTADVTNPTDRQAMVDAARQHFGGLDVLINNAGVGATGHFVEADPARLRTIFEVNFFGLTETTRLFLPVLKEGQKPAIVNISSIVAFVGIPGRSEYSASKFAVEGFSQALRAELVIQGIDVIVVSPGLTQSNFSSNMLEANARMKLDHMRGMTSDQAAEATLRSLERGRDNTVLTTQGRLLVMAKRFMPWLVDRVARWKVKSLFREEQQKKAAELAQRDKAPV